MIRLFLTLVLFFGTVSVPARGQQSPVDSAVESDSRYIIRCERKEVFARFLDDTLTVTLESRGASVAGFDLKLGVGDWKAAIVEVLPGPVLDSCGWEYFHVSQIQTTGKDGYPVSLWQAVALSTIIPDSTKPSQPLPEGQVPILKLVVSNRHLSSFVFDHRTPVFFFWEDCSDNALSDNMGSSLIVSSKVYDYYDVELKQGENVFPTRMGAPKQCLKLSAVNVPKRQVEFHNGGVGFGVGVKPVRPAKQ